MIIDVTDFTDRPYKVPNQEESRDFASFVASEEQNIAEKYLLGVDMWNEFNSAIEGSGDITFWQKLRDGASYEYNNKTYRYKGWADLMRPAIWAGWAPLGAFKFTNVGMVTNNAPQQSKLADDQYPYIVQAWNDFCSKVGIVPACGYNYKNSFYGFMKANETEFSSEFENWVFCPPQFKNRHDF